MLRDLEEFENNNFATEEQCPPVSSARLTDNDYLSSSENKSMGGVLRVMESIRINHRTDGVALSAIVSRCSR